MKAESLIQTSIWQSYLENDGCLLYNELEAYLVMMRRCRYEHILDPLWVKKYDNEIEATLEILKILKQ